MIENIIDIFELIIDKFIFIKYFYCIVFKKYLLYIFIVLC